MLKDIKNVKNVQNLKMLPTDGPMDGPTDRAR